MMGGKFKSIFTDAYILLIIFSVILLGFVALRSLLYPEGRMTEELVIRARGVPTEYRSALNTGDLLFDSITKRQIGRITEIKRIYAGNRVEFIITVDACRMPKGALRSREIWFEWEALDEEDYGLR